MALLYVVLLVTGVLWGTVRNHADPDLWHRLATGKLVWEEGAVPMYDRFSYRGKGGLVEDHEWLTGVIFYPLYLAAGLDIFVWVKLAIFTGILLLMLPPRRYVGRGTGSAAGRETVEQDVPVSSSQGVERRDVTFASGLFALVLAFALLPDLVSTIRCHAFSMLFWAAWLVWLERGRRSGRLPWVGVLVTSPLWINVHGGYAAGFGLLCVYAAGEWLNGRAWVPYAALASASALLTLVNPYFTGMWTSTVHALFVPHPDFISWHPPVMTDLSDPGFKMMLALVVLSAGPQLLRLRWRRGGPRAEGGARGDWVPVLVTSVAAVMALRQSRNGGLFALCAAIYAWPWMCEVWRATARMRRSARTRIPLRLWWMTRTTAAGSLAVVVGLVILGAVHEGQFRLSVRDVQYAPRAVAFLEQQLAQAPGETAGPARLVVPFNWGSYALWRLYPRALVSMDGRYELVYTIDTYLENERFFRAKGDWRKLLGGDPAPTHVLAGAKDPVTPLLKAEPGWRVAYEDEWAVVFTR
ncbi:hypothetical protein DB346_00665 [Verrucomicrobia bacterium LW23]|nr:hypothetical protein DB346_00665 [Verrucomicrobia bacterium LW23]